MLYHDFGLPRIQSWLSYCFASAKWLTEEKRTAMKATPTTPPCDCKLESQTNVMEAQGGKHCWALVAMTSSAAAFKVSPAIGLHFLERQAGLCDF